MGSGALLDAAGERLQLPLELRELTRTLRDRAKQSFPRVNIALAILRGVVHQPRDRSRPRRVQLGQRPPASSRAGGLSSSRARSSPACIGRTPLAESATKTNVNGLRSHAPS